MNGFDAAVVTACVDSTRREHERRETLLIVVFIDSVPIHVELLPAGNGCFASVLAVYWNSVQFVHVLPWEEE